MRSTHVGITVALAALAATAVVAGCGSDSSAAESKKVTLVAYSTPREVYEKLIPAFVATPEGEGVEFEQSYGASGEQSRAVAAGLPSDIVAFSLAPDMDRLVDADLVAKDWNAGPTKGFVSNSVVALIVRPGNPKNIKGWDDLTKDGVEVLTPNVFTSGGAKWNTMAAYGAQLAKGKSPAEAKTYLQELYRHVSVQDKSARESLQTFVSGKGDVLLGYENEAILAKEKGEDIDYVVPGETILIQNPIAATTNSGNPDAAAAFVNFALSPTGQKAFGDAGYRPVDPEVAKTYSFPAPAELFTIDDLGGWDKVNEEFFDRDKGLVADIFREAGTPVE